MPSDTRNKLITAATKRFYRDGFRNVGIDQLFSDVGISKTAFYKHFDCKEDLMLEVLKHKDRWLRETFREVIASQAENGAISQLFALVDTVGMFIESDGFHGCIFVNVSMEFPLPTEPAHQAALRNKLGIEEMVAEVAARAGATAPLALAQELCLIMEGAYVTFHVTRNPDTLAIVRRIARQRIESHVGASQKTAPE